MWHLLYCDTVGRIGSVGLLVLRLVMGAAFMHHGWSKIQNPMGWMGPEASMPAILQALAAISEFGGGLALIAGLLTRLGSLGITSVMVVALATVHLKLGHPFVAAKPGGPSYELPAVYLACAVMFLLLGPGRFSLDALLFGKLLGPQETGQNDVQSSSLVTPTRR
ncbi:MAG: DoxX family protein [Thermoguttaceae bacterium]